MIGVGLALTDQCQRRITEAFQQVLRAGHVDNEMEDRESVSTGKSARHVPGMTASEKFQRWLVAEPSEGGGQEDRLPPDDVVLDDGLDEVDEYTPDDDDDDAVLSELDEARIKFALKTSSFSWFLKAVETRPRFSYHSASVLQSIRQTMSSHLRQYGGNYALKPLDVVIRRPGTPEISSTSRDTNTSTALLQRWL